MAAIHRMDRKILETQTIQKSRACRAIQSTPTRVSQYLFLRSHLPGC